MRGALQHDPIRHFGAARGTEPEISIRLPRDSGFAAGAAPRNDEIEQPVNPLLTIHRAKIAQ